VVAPAAKRQAVAHLVQAHGVSERRACSLVGADRTMIRYRHRRPDDADLRERLRSLAGQRRRFGYRRLHVLLRQEGWTVNRKKTQRLYREEGLSVRRRRGRKRATGTRAPILTVAAPNARWSVDFVRDQLITGRRLRILNVVDDVTKECLASIVDTSISGKRVARELSALVAMRGQPEMIVSDHGTEFTSNAMLAWTEAAGVAWHFIAPGKPMRDTASAKPSTDGCGTSFSTRHCSSTSSRPAARSRTGSPTTTTAGRIPRSATRRRQPMRPGSPQWTAGSADRKRSAGRPLLHRRTSAKLKRRLRLQLDECRGSQHF
jgi:transposase InsO family protein